MPSMTLIMSTIFFADSLISPIVLTTSDTTAPPLTAISDADTARLFACRALSAFCLTVDVNSSIDDAVSSSELACCSVRDDRSRLPDAICVDALAIVSDACLICIIDEDSISCIRFMEYSRLVSSLFFVVTVMVRSPSAIPSTTVAA